MNKNTNNNKKILVITGDAETRERLSDILRGEGYEVKITGNGAEGLGIARKEKFHICLTGVKLPDISGIEILKELKTINPETYVIIISTQATKETAIEALKLGAHYYIEEPLNIDELLMTIEHVLTAHQLLVDKKRAEKELIETNAYLKNIFYSSADAITVVNMEGIVLTWNTGAENIFDYHADEIIGKSSLKFFADPKEADKIMEYLQREEKIRNYRTIVLRKDGKPVHISMSAALLREFGKTGAPIGTVCVSRDITKEVMLEEQIKIERDNMNLIFDSMVDDVLVTSEDYEIEFMNKVLVEKFGCHVGSICYKVFHEGKESCPGCKLSDVLNGNVIRREWHSRRKNRTYDLMETPIRNADGSISKLTIFRDITDRKRAEKELQQLIRELKTANEMMERFVYTVSHDLRSPLITIQGFIDLLREDMNANEMERAWNDLEYIKNNAAKMDLLLTDTLHLSRIGRIVKEPESVQFGELVHETLEQIAGQIRSSNVEVSVADEFPIVQVDRIRIVEVLVNLIENSINYMGEQPHPKIEIGYRMDDDSDGDGEEQEPEPVFFVRDNGIGIDKSQHEKVFELFYKVEKNSKGTGAGLTIVKQIIEVHGGRIWIESEMGKGCTVCFTLPTSQSSISVSSQHSLVPDLG